MRQSTTQRAVEAVAAEIDALGADLGQLVEVLRQSQPGPTARPLDTIGRSPGSISDRTASEAFVGDPASRDLADLDRAVRQLVAATTRVSAIRRAWLGDRATRATWRSTARPAVERRQAEGCAVMAAVGHHEPIEAVTDLGGLLDAALPVGRWVRDFSKRHGRLPTEIECRARAAGRKPRVTAR